MGPRQKTIVAKILLSALPFAASIPSQAQENGRIEPILLRAVVQITTPQSTRGTAFIVAPQIPSPPGSTSSPRVSPGPFYLVTNKHMIGNWSPCPDANSMTQVFDWVDGLFYTEGPQGNTFQRTRILLKGPDGGLIGNKVFINEDNSIDIAVIDVSDEIRNLRSHVSLAMTAIGADYMVRYEGIDKQLTGIGDLVFALGYPRGISAQTTNHPIAKAGYMASVPGEEMSVSYACGIENGRPQFATVKGKILIIDGLITHGNSGGPVVLGGGMKMRHDPKTGIIEYSTADIKNLVCGVVSFEIKGLDLQPGSGLTAVFSSDYVLDLLAKATAHK